MALTGHADGPPSVTPASVYALLEATVSALSSMTAQIGERVEMDAGQILTRRAATAGTQRRGRVSVGGATELLRTSDGWCAVTLSRPDDVTSLPAVLGRPTLGDPWAAVEAAAAEWSAIALADRAQLLGVPAAALPRTVSSAVPWRAARLAPAADSVSLRGRRVVDLSSMWAGPLCARILADAGAHVVKVESTARPDGARRGDPQFFDWLHRGHEFRTLDFSDARDRRTLHNLLDQADIVIEASRPRALAALGLAPEDLRHRRGKIWVSLTGYGRSDPMRVAFGDDAAVAGGLVGWQNSEPVFCADAIADPLTGVCAALAAVCAVRAGGGLLLDVSMRDTAAAFAAAPTIDHGPHPVRPDAMGWAVECPSYGLSQQVLPPRVSAGRGRTC
ncbi:CoA transferase [Nocardia sp. XZ_19_231]|uniref:CoA transferase n=1 Tax=Nocardia sp. XZ_19_231 TaxID=2769252 RepID=UPI00188E882E|nr:CoA transferase [Nocardia sp. XZ_19_231]